MAYPLDFGISLGGGQIGLTLEAQIVDSSGVTVGSPITTGFSEIGQGNYLWHTTAIPANHRGGVIFRVSGGGTVKAFTSINPEENEGKVALKPDGLDAVEVEYGVNARQALSLATAALAGILRQTGVNEITIRAVNNNSITRIQATVNPKGERLSVTLNIPT